MPSNSQYSRALFVDGLDATSTSTALNRVHFSKQAGDQSVFDEAWLQNLIMRHSSVLPVDEIERAFTPLIPVCLELPCPAGFIDNLFVTPKGHIAFVECKLWRNAEARREVFAQVLDYAKHLSGWTYDKLEESIKKAKSFSEPPIDSGRLYDYVLQFSQSSEADSQLSEADFHDAVSRNLRLGRFLILIVGDGIREGVEGFADFLQQYAGFHFTLGLVELAVFQLPKGGYFVEPRLLAKTVNIERGIVSIGPDGRLGLQPPPEAASVKTGVKRTSITQEDYCEGLEKNCQGITSAINQFIDELTDCNVTAEFGTERMLLRWRPEMGRVWNLAEITGSGGVLTETLGIQAREAGLAESHKKYLISLAALIPDGYVKETPRPAGWYVAFKTANTKSGVVFALLTDPARRQGWINAIQEFQAAVNKIATD